MSFLNVWLGDFPKRRPAPQPKSTKCIQIHKHKLWVSKTPSVRSLQMIASEIWYYARPQSWSFGTMMMGDVFHQHFWSSATTAKQTHSLKIRYLWNKKLIVACLWASETWHRAAFYQRESDVVFECFQGFSTFATFSSVCLRHTETLKPWISSYGILICFWRGWGWFLVARGFLSCLRAAPIKVLN